MLPKIIQEATICPFKFWSGQHVRIGMTYCGELFYCLQTTRLTARTQLFQLACQLGHQGADVLLTLTPEHCRLWVGLRSQSIEALSSTRLPSLRLPQLLES